MPKNENLDHGDNRLIKKYEAYEEGSLTDHLLIIAKDIEDELLHAGAIPGKDYTYMQIFELAGRYKAQ